MNVRKSEYEFVKNIRFSTELKRLYSISKYSNYHVTDFKILDINGKIALRPERGTKFHPISDLIVLCIDILQADRIFYVSYKTGDAEILKKILVENGHDLYLPSSTAR